MPLAAEVPRGQEPVEIVEQRGARARAGHRHHAGQGREPRIADRLEHPRRDDLALAAHDAVDRALGVLEELGGDERGAVAAHEHERVRPPRLRVLGQIDHLGHVREVVHGEADRLRREGGQLLPVIDVGEDLQVEQADLVTRRAHRGRHAFETERLESQVELGVHQGARVHEQHSHGVHSFRTHDT